MAPYAHISTDAVCTYMCMCVCMKGWVQRPEVNQLSSSMALHLILWGRLWICSLPFSWTGGQQAPTIPPSTQIASTHPAPSVYVVVLGTEPISSGLSLFSCLGHSLFRSLGGTVHGHWSGCLDHYASENNGCVTDMRHGYNLPTSCPSNLARLQDQQRTLHQTLICNSQELPDTKWADAKTSRWGRKINKL